MGARCKNTVGCRAWCKCVRVVWPSGKGGAVPAHVGPALVPVVEVNPVWADTQALGRWASQQLAVQPILLMLCRLQSSQGSLELQKCWSRITRTVMY